MLAKRQDDTKAATRFRSQRKFQDLGAWFFFTREGTIEGPFRDEAETDNRLETYIKVAQSAVVSGNANFSLE